MSGSAIVMMLVAMLIIWGGLALAVVNLRRSPDIPHTDEVSHEI
ncbi:hypothetical protein J2S40_004120 [Nocardioides luteus]|uniref:Methionine/alanine importer small subunit n=1 Tax=Nocardioides luteus TaxID=1844 RepID=A0ABQ5SRA3_9ACTN|nr:methionine/alanine import family NSS transporter small subunit [Nocardioides luteus]MDR7313062.1 hypothetical protein [Nocardioides luteus]GGR44387.1 hypothetical protein GCM10010197_07380 [Nocardioides luteus]GLJ66123.1 hypothetical protein GCM10017579_01590 [Nocardioides luteus]